MTRFFVNPDNTYWGGYEGPNPPTGLVEVPFPPPGLDHLWDGSAWVLDPVAASARIDSVISETLDLNAVARTFFEINYLQENRLRALEALPSITRVQYRGPVEAFYRSVLEGN